MQPRMKNPAMYVPGALEALQAFSKSAEAVAAKSGLPKTTIDLVLTRVSQINGCAVCLDMHTRSAKKAGETDPRLHTLAAWRESPYFEEPERAALALAEAGTRVADRSEPVSDDVFAAAAKHYDEPALAALVVIIAGINAWNRLNIITGQVAGEWTAQYAE
jgi:AhpD family alkylhydroperoxidase